MAISGAREHRMARMDLRARAFASLTRRQSSVAAMTEEQVLALQSRAFPSGKVTDWIFGATAPGVEVTNQTIPGPGGELPPRGYRPAGPAPPRARALVVCLHGGGGRPPGVC